LVWTSLSLPFPSVTFYHFQRVLQACDFQIQPSKPWHYSLFPFKHYGWWSLNLLFMKSGYKITNLLPLGFSLHFLHWESRLQALDNHKIIFISFLGIFCLLINDSVYSCLFFFLTGLHFFHLLVGLLLCYLFFCNCNFISPEIESENLGKSS